MALAGNVVNGTLVLKDGQRKTILQLSRGLAERLMATWGEELESFNRLIEPENSSGVLAIVREYGMDEIQLGFNAAGVMREEAAGYLADHPDYLCELYPHLADQLLGKGAPHSAL